MIIISRREYDLHDRKQVAKKSTKIHARIQTKNRKSISN